MNMKYLILTFAAMTLTGFVDIPKKNVVEEKATPESAVVVEAVEPNVPQAGTLPGGEDTADDLDSEAVAAPPVLEPQMLKAREWMGPNYSNQEAALGYSPETFSVPKGFEQRVDFWKFIYTKVTTSQGVLHDADNLNIIYETIDFGDVENRKARQKLIKEKKAELKARLLKLEKVKDPSSLEGIDLQIWKSFESVNEPNKFSRASMNGRLRFQLGQSDRFKLGVYYSGRYLKKMETIFREEGLPIELTRLPFVESSFNLQARSKVGASGIWQFMRGTGRLYKLKMTGHLDERNDPLRATRASAKLLKDNFNLLGTWPLALTGYNHGPSGVRRLSQKHQTKDIVELVKNGKSRRFGFASENFYACFLAALQVEKDAKTYWPDVQWSEELNYVEVELPKAVSFGFILNFFGGNQDLADIYNPHYSWRIKRGFSNFSSGFKIKIPAGTEQKFAASLESEPTLVKAPAAIRNAEADSYRVERGDTLSDIARRFGVSLRLLMETNQIFRARGLRVGQTLVIPGAD